MSIRRAPRRLGRGVATCWVALQAIVAVASNEAPAIDLQRAPAGLLPARLPVTGGPAWRLRAFVADFDAADAVPVRNFSGRWDDYAPRAGRNAALESAQAELSATRGAWEIALVGRTDFIIDATRGAYDVVRADKRRETPPAGSRFDAAVDATGIVWAGARAAHTWAFGGSSDASGAARGVWQFSGGLTLLSVRRVETIDARGHADFDGTTYAFEASGTRKDSFREFEGYGRPRSTGAGLSADFGVAWRPAADTVVNLSVVDALSTLRVDNVATEQVDATSATTSIGADGFLAARPLLSGRYSATSVRLRLAPKVSLLAGHAFDTARGSMLAGMRVEQVRGLTLPAAWSVVPLTRGLALQIDAELRFRSIGVGLAGRHGGVFVRTRSLAIAGTRALGWQAWVEVPL